MPSDIFTPAAGLQFNGAAICRKKCGIAVIRFSLIKSDSTAFAGRTVLGRLSEEWCPNPYLILPCSGNESINGYVDRYAGSLFLGMPIDTDKNDVFIDVVNSVKEIQITATYLVK